LPISNGKVPSSLTKEIEIQKEGLISKIEIPMLIIYPWWGDQGKENG